MVKKARTVFVCQECGYESPKWMGQCICGAWNSFLEEKLTEPDPSGRADAREALAAMSGRKADVGTHRAVPLSGVTSGQRDRIDTGIDELNRVLGGGIVRGSITLIAGEPGIGKSTLILQTAAKIAKSAGTVLYVSGEESEEQIKMRADRLPDKISDDILILAETNMESIIEAVGSINPAFLIIDSIQTMYSRQLESAAGSVSQVRACTNSLMGVGKVLGIPVFMVAHVTKSGELAGPKIIEHLVDCVLQFSGDRNQDFRILRASKNRFGTTSEIGAFEMREEGLAEIGNLSGSLLEGLEEAAEGAVATAVYEGTRPLLLEMQALTAPAGTGFPRRTALGVEPARLNMIIAVLERKAGLRLSEQDVYVNAVGGIRPEGTSVDLAVALAIYSSAKGLCLPAHTLVVGEVGLTGELRSVRGADKIVRESVKLGFENIILPKKNIAKLNPPEGARLIGVSGVRESLALLITTH